MIYRLQVPIISKFSGFDFQVGTLYSLLNGYYEVRGLTKIESLKECEIARNILAARGHEEHTVSLRFERLSYSKSNE
jgi:hypothetical protein